MAAWKQRLHSDPAARDDVRVDPQGQAAFLLDAGTARPATTGLAVRSSHDPVAPLSTDRSNV